MFGAGPAADKADVKRTIDSGRYASHSRTRGAGGVPDRAGRSESGRSAVSDSDSDSDVYYGDSAIHSNFVAVGNTPSDNKIRKVFN